MLVQTVHCAGVPGEKAEWTETEPLSLLSLVPRAGPVPAERKECLFLICPAVVSADGSHPEGDLIQLHEEHHMYEQFC